MVIGPFSAVSSRLIPSTQRPNIPFIGFGSSQSASDRFERSVTVLKGQIPPKLKEFIGEFERHPEGFTPRGWGADGNVYRLKDVPGYPNGLAVKVSHIEKENAQGQMQRVGKTFEEEAVLLEKLPSTIPAVQRLVAQVKTPGRNYLVTTWMSGTSPDPVSNPITPRHLKRLLNQLAHLDGAGILHRDLKRENLLVDGPRVNLVDFGAAATFSLFNVDENTATHHTPPFSPPANSRNFEDTFLFPYLRTLSETGHGGRIASRALFKKYLVLRSDYHLKRQQMIAKQLQETSLSESTRQALEAAMDYEGLQAKLFKKPTEALVDLEALKIQMTYCTEEAYRHEILEKKPYANLLWKLHSLSTIRRFLQETGRFKLQASGDLERFLNYQTQLGQFRREKVHEWYRGAEGWVVGNLMGQHDGRDYAADMIEQLEDPAVVEFKPLQDVASLLRTGSQ